MEIFLHLVNNSHRGYIMNFTSSSSRRRASSPLCVMLIFLLFISLLGAIEGSFDDVEVVFLPSRRSGVQDEVPLAFTAFGHTIELRLQKNDKLLAPSFQVWRHNNEAIVERVSELSEPPACHYLHRDTYTTAAISLCEEGVVNGIVLLDNAALEITPLRDEAKTLDFLDRLSSVEDRTQRFSRSPHVVKRSYLSSIAANASGPHARSNEYINFAKRVKIGDRLFTRTARDETSNDLTMELAIFFDQAAYSIFSPFLDGDERKIRDMLLAYINGVQALYYHPSLGERINIALVRLDIMHRQPVDLPHYNGERGDLLNTFCAYAEKHNPVGDDDPRHWDMALYVSGLDFYAAEDGSRVTMGLAPVNGTCYAAWSCVIAELGVTNRFGKPYPSAGFTSVYIAAHEIGHNLGMRHDSIENSCSKDGFIMSPSRGTQGETIWSPCSRDVALRLRRLKPCLLDVPSSNKDVGLDHERYHALPGREWTSKRQCEFLLRDKDATVATLTNACQALQCRSPHRSGYYFAGPALDGTFCAQGKECRGGECVPALQLQQQRPISENPEIMREGWTKWKEDKCSSGCIEDSKGAKARRRTCREKSGINKTMSTCIGFDYDVQLCKDEKICKKRVTATDYAATKCRLFSKHLDELDAKGGGLQAPHETARLWMGCAIFCKRSDIASYYTPRIELNDLGLDPYFPDGTWCHSEEGEDYFCLRHHCLPENFRFGKDSLMSRYGNEDSFLGPQNARPDDYDVPEQLVKYLSLGVDGLPLSRTLPPRLMKPINEDAWIDKDYLELPENPGLSIVGEDFLSRISNNDDSEEINDNLMKM